MLYCTLRCFHLAASNKFAEKISSLFIVWNMVNPDLGVWLKIILMAWAVLTPQFGLLVMIKSVSSELPKSIFWLHLTSLAKSSNFTLDIAAHFLYLNIFVLEYETDNPTTCNISTKSRDFDTLWMNSSIDKRREINMLHSYKTGSPHGLWQSFGDLSFSLLSLFVIWSRSYQGKFSVVLVLQELAVLDSICSVMDRICRCTQSVQSVNHLAETLWKFLMLLQENCLKWCFVYLFAYFKVD